ncbi:hypothetical protein CLF_113183 [Clonorchis sinensis]|uniref:Uncharacterized protein n=1 Tax=Clonorchis sinensis TaxID=79923 RepID=H2KVU2_CLOSI|nr:hypothetical protein CLF_113183 [Clonorchis sinensis]
MGQAADKPGEVLTLKWGHFNGYNVVDVCLHNAIFSGQFACLLTVSIKKYETAALLVAAPSAAKRERMHTWSFGRPRSARTRRPQGFAVYHNKRFPDPKSPSALPPVCSKKRLRARRPSFKPAHFSRPAKTVFQATSDRSVVLTDIPLPPQPDNTILSPLPVGSEVLNDLENLRIRVHQMEKEMSVLRTIQSIACILNPDATCDPTNLEKASILIDTIASEICQRIECRHQVLTFNAPDRISLGHTKTSILTARGMQDIIYTARRLRKSKPSMRCQIIVQSRMKRMPRVC